MRSRWQITCALVVCLAGAGPGMGQSASDPASRPGAGGPPSTRPTAPTTARAEFKPEEFEQLVAPVALYPDSLLAQVFMASTYPLEVVQADRWLKANPKLKDVPEELNKLPWDPSVKSLLDFQQVLTMMSEKLDWTVKLGDAFLADRKALMEAVQRLRKKAYDKGNLKSSPQQKVSLQDAEAGATAAPASSQVIVVESANPSVVYVPAYNPTVVYGTWPYPAYPPVYYPSPGYVAAASAVSFGVGMAVGAAWGHAWGHCDWHGSDVDIDVNRNVNYNNNINRNNYNKNNFNNNNVNNNRAGGQGTRNSFQHDPSHRQGVAYRDAKTNEQYRGAGASQRAAQARDSYRGRAEAGRQDLSRGAASDYRGSGTGGGRGGSYAGASDRSSAGGNRAGSSSGSRGTSASSRDYSGTRSSGFSGIDSGSSSTRAASSRGQSSRSSSSYSGSRGGGSSGGGARSGGGGRSGGGARGGGGRR